MLGGRGQREASEDVQQAEEGGQEEEPKAPEGVGDGADDMQFEITHKGERADAQVLADATEEQFEQEDKEGAKAAPQDPARDEGDARLAQARRLALEKELVGEDEAAAAGAKKPAAGGKAPGKGPKKKKR